MELDLIDMEDFHLVMELVKTIIFGVDMSSSTKIENRKKDILILGKGLTQGLENMLRAEKLYAINFIDNQKFCLSLHYNKENSYLFFNGTKIINLNQKILKFFQIHYA